MCYVNNNLSQKFAAKDISNKSLDQITTTGFYFGSNITEVTPYIASHKWCLINAFVSGKSASIFVMAGDAMALSIYRNGDGRYSHYPIATKSDFERIGTPTKLCSFSATGNASVSLSAYKFLFMAGIYNGQILTSQLIPKSRFNNSGMFLAYKDAESSQYRAKLSLGSSTIGCTIFENFSSVDVYGIS